MAPTQTPVVEVKNLVAHYGARVVLNGADLTVQTGSIHVIMGGSGSGKSTLVRHLLGLATMSCSILDHH